MSNLINFKYNRITGMWSRILLLADGKRNPYQNEVMLTPVNLAGYPRNWDEVAEINVVKYFHPQLPDDVSYYHELPSDVEREMLSNLPYNVWDILVQKDIRLVHVALPSGFIVKGKDCISNFDELMNPLATVGSSELGAELKASLFGKDIRHVE